KSLTMAYEGETKSVALTANCEWTTAPSAGWLTVAPASGNGATTLSIVAAANEGDARDGKVTITSKDGKATAEIMVAQAGKPSDNPDPEPQGNTIKTLEQLSEFLAKAAEVPADEEWSLEADIDCNKAVIEPIKSFSGILDGKNHKVYNYAVVSKDATAGLFLNVSGTVKNVILGSKDGKSWDNFSTISFDESVEATGHIGGVSAELLGTLENVKNFAKVQINMKGAKVGVGGIVGSITAPANVRGCENGGQIALSIASMTDGAWVGGIVGHAENADILIENCVNSVDLEFADPNPKYLMYGGIVGCSHKGATVDGCQNLGAVKLNQSVAETSGTYIMIAGIAGALYTGSVVRNSVNKGEVSSNRMQVSRIGGIVGTLNSKGIIEGNTNEGKVVLKQANPNDNWQAAGGICGFQEKENADNFIRNNTNKGSVSVEVENATTHNNKVSAGGILGLGVLGLEISGNVNSGEVSVVNKAAGPCYAGGIVGWYKGAGTFTSKNENSAKVSCATSDNAAAVAGGVVGYSSDAANVSTEDKNTGAVVCANAAAAGSIAGTNMGKLVNCKAGGSVNGTALSSDNLGKLTQGASSSGTAEGTTLAN
ncbi:MAG: BACON domain-containing protein, partial [Bacteroidales bacterium]|nr:BACON domain-containing protein [Bacteroidales bacterium]